MELSEEFVVVWGGVEGRKIGHRTPERRKGEVLESVFACFYAGLRLRVTVQSPYDHLRIRFGLRELGF